MPRGAVLFKQQRDTTTNQEDNMTNEIKKLTAELETFNATRTQAKEAFATSEEIKPVKRGFTYRKNNQF